MFDVFEEPWALLGAAVIVLFAMLTFRSVWPEKRHWWQLALPALVTVVAFGVDAIVATDREKIHTVLKEGMKAVEQEDCDALRVIISDDYQDSYHSNKAQLIAHCRTELRRSPVERVRKANLFIEVSAPEARAVLIAGMKFAKDSFVAQNYRPGLLIKARLYFGKLPDGNWLIQSVEVIEIDKQPVNWRQIR